MSGIAGVWNLDGRPVERPLITRIGTRIAHRGRDISDTWCADSIAFTAHVARVTPESETEQQPLTDDNRNALVFDGRIDNREDLIRQLSLVGRAATIPDAAVVLAAFQKWGSDSLARIEGEFALAFFDAGNRRLTLARDPVGCRPLYYWFDGQYFVFASEIKAILTHPVVEVKPNQDLIADLLVRHRLAYEDEGDTFFEGIYAVLPGRRTTISPGRMSTDTFWDFDPRQVVRLRSYSDYAARLRELLVLAVRRRLRSSHPVAIAVSGGLDSSIVLCVADDLRKSGAVNACLLPVSGVASARGSGDESRFLALLESTRELNIGRVEIGAPGSSRDLEQAAWHSEYPRIDDAWHAHRPILEWAAARRARVLLTGHWSDQFLFVTGYLSDLWRRFAWREVRAHLDEYSRWFVDADPAYFRTRFRREFVLNLTPYRVRHWLGPLAAGRVTREQSGSASPSLAAHAGRTRVRLPRPPCRTAHARDIYQAVRRLSHRLQFEADEKLAASQGVESLTPFLDRDVIAFLMSIPGEVQNRDGVPRALLRDSMRGIVPDAILRRTWRNEDAVARDRQRSYVACSFRLDAARHLGLVSEPHAIDDETFDWIGLEFWSRAFFSDRLSPRQPSHHETGEVMDTAVRPPDNDDREKLPYSPPRLTIHGDLRKITAAKQSDRAEAGQPKTFNTGMP
jgi:asparagine synthase (glutamine-hydrolysing)